MDKASASQECCSSGSFVTKLYKMVDTEPATIVSWIRGGTAFCIVDPKMMAEHCLPKYFRHRRFSSLIRQLNFYSFYRVQEGQLTIYQHSFFRKGRPDLLVHIKRRGAGKAKDPWFDPLAPPSKPSAPVNMNSLMVSAPMDTRGPLADVSPMNTSASMLCYSPMAKPLAAPIDNMSPALKPGIAHLAPPVVDLGGNMSLDDGEKYMASQRWGSQLMDLNDTKNDLNGVITRSDFGYSDMPVMMLNAGPTKTMSSNSIDIDVQDFLTDDCTINAGLLEKNSPEDRATSQMGSGGVVSAKHAMVARDCLKWETVDGYGQDAQRDEEDAAFEEELLMDLANVEPGTWEMPLSPLNDEEEDMMPWLDLCF
ncbi:hypothetical protein Poli38472_007188 [Pythium oligandrum]|uniref:HSF-type DNA-binding domain-containing protein n=1 Tax=Pythium oligandrum TaxID=41045 RepID=A0A8K1C9S5_PYTOL|nr:hypothetical protein Poli38472_007188 [Pythium oligandrum]|eukprot:TMW59043.1 hypothetical protein Poli38472_007188 [Pythium oligandrum]